MRRSITTARRAGRSSPSGWFLKRLQTSKATWKIWGSSTGTVERRADPQNLPAGLTTPWPGAGYATYEDGDHAIAYAERAEIYDLGRSAGITGFVTVAGDRHSFWAGLAAPALPPRPFEPGGAAFITASLSAPSSADLLSEAIPNDHSLRSLYFTGGTQETPSQPAVNLLLKHGVRSCLEYARTGDVERARAVSNPHLAPHLKFVDFQAHGYAIVRATAEALECEFVCIPRPLERASGADGGPVVYRVAQRVRAWRAGEKPQLEQRLIEGNPKLSL